MLYKETNMHRYRFRVGGLCQGVGFRWTAAHCARKFGLCGWVKNMDDGSVRLEAQGSMKDISEFIDYLRSMLKTRGLDLQIDSMDEIPLEECSGFNILY